MTTPQLLMIAVPLMWMASSAFAQPSPTRPSDPARGVTLSLTEYNRLIDLAAATPRPAATAPVAAVLASADLRIRLDRDAARGVFNVSGEVLRAGVSRVNVLTGGTLLAASATGRPIPLVAEGNVHSALVSGPGPFTLALAWGAPVAFRPGRASFVVPVPPVGTASATIDLPGEQAEARLSAGLITNRTVAGGRTIIEATLDPGSSTEVSWSMRDSGPTPATRELRTLADVMTLITLTEADVRMAALIDLSVVQGELRTLTLGLPAGYEFSSVSGRTIATSLAKGGAVTITMSDPAARSHQLLVTLERPHAGGSLKIDTGFITVSGVQRERGEVTVEGIGTLELSAVDREGVHRMDVREINPALQALARLPLLAAFRYQRTATAAPTLTLDVTRFADAGVLAAVADKVVATTLITSEGRALTEISLRIQNRAQPFLKVTLPLDASIVSVEVAGQTAKPVLGADGIRVPLLRAGFRPSGAYDVSFVYLHSSTPFARKGETNMTLPRMDIPVGVVEWEVFVPERYRVRSVGGNAIEAGAFARFFKVSDDGRASGPGAGFGGGVGGGRDSAAVDAAGRVTGETAGALQETVRVTGESPAIDLRASVDQPSQNVINLQRRTAGVLPIRVDVPRAGTSHRFIKPLMVDQEAVVTLRYKRR